MNQEHVFDVLLATYQTAKFLKIARAEPKLQKQIRPMCPKQEFFSITLMSLGPFHTAKHEKFIRTDPEPKFGPKWPFH